MSLESMSPLEGSGVTGALAATIIEGLLPGVVQVQSSKGRGAGAGFVWSSNGSVMTNHHVVAGSGRVRVVLADDRSFGAEVVGQSRRLDLAMLRLRDAPAEDLPTLPIGDSETLRVGELVFAVGNPWGRCGAVTAGIVSGLGTAGRPFGRARYIQSDAYLAPGNSGGPLVNARGEVVGVNAMVFGGLSLAIPINTAGAWASGGPRAGRSTHPRLGIRVQGVVLPASSQETAGQETGLIIVAVNPRGPAARAGLLVGDVLLSVADEPVVDAASLPDSLARAASSGSGVRLRVMRGSKVREVGANLEDLSRSRRRGA